MGANVTVRWVPGSPPLGVLAVKFHLGVLAELLVFHPLCFSICSAAPAAEEEMCPNELIFTEVAL